MAFCKREKGGTTYVFLAIGDDGYSISNLCFKQHKIAVACAPISLCYSVMSSSKLEWTSSFRQPVSITNLTFSRETKFLSWAPGTFIGHMLRENVPNRR